LSIAGASESEFVFRPWRDAFFYIISDPALKRWAIFENRLRTGCNWPKRHWARGGNVISFIAIKKRNQSLALLRRQIGRWVFFFPPKKVPPPTPDGREGRLFPPEQSWKTALLVTELGFSRNKILRELTPPWRGFNKTKPKKGVV